ncbi:hypothetical protein RB653_008671 [Dictyostelium firmibasis]|uniref:Histone H2A n=1 Tax=Dictyostelium firmibasis TaxID=79012 RepID=A0AAN7U0Q2_9MYCE
MKKNENNYIIPLSKIKKSLKIYGCKRIGRITLIFFSNVLQYLIEELLEISMNVSSLNKRNKFTITPQDISWSIQSDPEFNKLFRNIIIPSSGRPTKRINRIIQRPYNFKSFNLEDTDQSDHSSKSF